jgi:hypothetical protein
VLVDGSGNIVGLDDQFVDLSGEDDGDNDE